MRPTALALLLAVLLTSSCTVVRVGSHSGPPRLESNGLVDGHVALGISDETHLLHLDLFDGSSSGAIGELVIWKLFRLELGLLGASLTLGPLHLGLGVIAYDPVVPGTMDFGDDDDDDDDDERDDESAEEEDDDGVESREHDH